ncbi:MAG: hypothetical protein ACKVGT_01990 [Flavobacteriales bacterium]|tara:strand:- start:944 stop:3967 length:3024 start_codon:yes stop_codon:yes gene_type:complete
MRIAKKSKKKKSVIYLILALLVILTLLFTKYSLNESHPIGPIDTTLDLENTTEILSLNGYRDLVEKDEHQIYKDGSLSIYLVKEYGTPYIIYVYKGTLTQRERDDRFFLHVYLKDSLKFVDRNLDPFLNLDFQANGNFTMQDNGGVENYIFKKQLIHDNYIGRIVQFEDIDSINTGRFLPKIGRSKGIEGLKPNLNASVEISSDLDHIKLFISDKNFKKIQQKRDDAIVNRVLLTSEEDLVKAKVTINGQKQLKASVRLKGDWTDHLKDEKKWSYRVIMKGGKTLLGMRKFSIQDPKTRNYAWEWLFNKVVKEHDLIGLRYDFVKTSVFVNNDEDVRRMSLGIMALEESFDKILIENNKKREGIILAFDESLLWNDRANQYQLRLPNGNSSKVFHSAKVAPIKVYNENKVLSDPKLKKQFTIAKDLFEGLREGRIKISEAFDLDKLTTFVALSNLFGGKHGLYYHNLRIYYNPITSKLEPISFDSNSGQKLSGLVAYPFAENDPIYSKKLVEKLRLVSSSEFIKDMMNRHDKELNKIINNLNLEFNISLDASIIEHNSNMIKKNIHPADAIISSLSEYDDQSITIVVTNVSALPVEILNLEHKDGKKLNKKSSPTIVKPNEKKEITFSLKASFVNAFVSKKNKKTTFRYPQDVAKLRLTHTILGLDYIRKNAVLPYGQNKDLKENIEMYTSSFRTSYQEFDFVEVNSRTNEITIKTGNHELSQNLIIPSNFKVIIEKGCHLDFKNSAYLLSYSHIICQGTLNNPIRFYSSDSTGAGIFITNAKETSIVDYCTFSNLSNPMNDMWELSGAVNFHESNVVITNSVFEQNRCEDALNIIRSQFSMSTTQFKNIKSDAFDGDFVDGALTDCTFINTGNDAIDVSGSTLYLERIEIKNPSDKAISAGEASTINGKGIQVHGGEIGIVSKDLSTVSLSEVTIQETRLGISAFQKKSEYGFASINISNLLFVNNEVDYLIETGSKLWIDSVEIPTVSNNVIDKMYGNEFGKSSR